MMGAAVAMLVFASYPGVGSQSVLAISKDKEDGRRRTRSHDVDVGRRRR